MTYDIIVRMKDSFLLSILIGFVGGIFFRSLFNLGTYFFLLPILIGWAVFIFYLLQSERNKNIVFVSLFLLFVGLGIFRFDISGFDKDYLSDELIVRERVLAKGIIIEEPDIRENNTHLNIRISEIGQIKTKSKENVLIIVNHYPQYKYGDLIELNGVLARPENFKSSENEKESREFDYISYLAKDNIHYQMFYPKTKFISDGNGNVIKEKLFALKNSFIFQIKKVIPEPHASLLGGLIVGAKESLGKELQDDFRKVGLIHIVVLSGYNITIIADSLMGVFSFLPQIFSLSVGAISIILFAIMTGASATIVRASVMALLVLLARATGRVSEITRSLFIAGFLMLLHNPTILVFDPSFQLSFMTTLGLIVVSPKIEKYFGFMTERFNLKESLVAVISTQIFVLPLLLYMMGDLSVMSVFVNLLVLVFIPATMLFGFLTGVFGFFSTILAMPFAYITYGLLAYELKIVDIFSNLPFASVHISYFPLWLMLFFYLLLFFVFFFSNITSGNPTGRPTQLKGKAS